MVTSEDTSLCTLPNNFLWSPPSIRSDIRMKMVLLGLSICFIQYPTAPPPNPEVGQHYIDANGQVHCFVGGDTGWFRMVHSGPSFMRRVDRLRADLQPVSVANGGIVPGSERISVTTTSGNTISVPPDGYEMNYTTGEIRIHEGILPPGLGLQ